MRVSLATVPPPLSAGEATAAPTCWAMRGLGTPRVAARGRRAEMVQRFILDVAIDDYVIATVIDFYLIFSICDF